MESKRIKINEFIKKLKKMLTKTKEGKIDQLGNVD